MNKIINNNNAYSYEDNEYENIFSRFLPDDSATFVEFCSTADHQDIPLGSHLHSPWQPSYLRVYCSV